VSESKQSKAGERDPLTERIIRCAIEVHRILGPGLLESAYQQCMAHELALERLAFRAQATIPVAYKGTLLDCVYRIDIIVQDSVVLELKSVDSLSRLHQAQLLTYMRISGKTTGLLINFNVSRLVDGVNRLRL